jgi:hypothetical protein
MTEINENEILGCFEAVSNIAPNPEMASRDIERVREKLNEIFREKFEGKGYSAPVFIRTQIAKIAAIIVLAVVILASLNNLRDSHPIRKPISSFTLLSRACAAEQAVFTGEHIVHITNEIIVYPDTDQNPVAERLDQLNLSDGQRNYIETVSSWLDFNWMPICSLKADGQFRFHELKLTRQIDQPYTITDQAWYDPETGRFARVMETTEEIIFANSYDGQAVHFSQRAPDGTLGLLSERIKENFNPPQNPAEFLGITAGLRSSLEHDDYAAISEITDGTLEDGTTVRIYKQGFADLLGDINTYWLFKVRLDDDTIAEMEFVKAGSTQLIIRRVAAETIEQSPHSWDLTEIEKQIGKGNDNPIVDVGSNVWIPDVSLQHMVDNAGFETYIFASTPSWLSEPVISDGADFASPGRRMFGITYKASDNRHIIIYQAHTFNTFFASIAKQARLIYKSANGFTVLSGGPEKQWTEIQFISSGFKPAEDRTGYLLQSPAGTFPSLAINGQLTEDELQQLVDSLVPVRKVLELSSDELKEIKEKGADHE